MQHYYALASIIYMMGFVIVFEGTHYRQKMERLFRSISFLSPDEVDQVRAIWAACQDT
jgi:hypothetical protein